MRKTAERRFTDFKEKNMKRALSFVILAAMLFSLAAGTAGATANAGGSPADSYVPISAEHEDGEINLWFEYPTAKVKTTDTVSSGLDTFTVYMAKNDIQGAQFILYSESPKQGLTAEITDFSNGGASIPAELFYEIYASAADDTPDAIPPLKDAFDLTAGLSKAFYFKLKTTDSTPAGDYSATLTIKNSDGEEVKKAEVFAHVWDFTLTEKTSIATAVYLSSNNLKSYYGTQSASTVYTQYYDYLLENRICAFDLPKEPYHPAVRNYLENPRVTSFKITGSSSYFSNLDEVETFLSRFNNDRYMDDASRQLVYEKGFFYLADEPQAYMIGWTGDTCNTVTKRAEAAKAAFPGIRYVVPFHENYPVQYTDSESGETVLKDAVQHFMDSDAISVWCTKPYAYMDNKYLDLIPGTRTLNGTIAYENNRDGFTIPKDTNWDEKYGQFADRIKAYRAEKDIDEWWYCAGSNGGSGTPNVLITDSGIASVMLGWQMTKYDIEGWLYYYCNNWVKGDEYQSLDKGDPGKIGDGILLYPGEPIGQVDTVVGTLRLECLRDGIEDALMLRMYESLTSTEKMQALINRVAKNVVQYTSSDKEFSDTRIYLGEEIEKLTKGLPVCEHDYDAKTVEKTNSTRAGKISHTCSVCGDTYFEIPDPLERMPGDVNGDRKVNIADVTVLRRFIAGYIDEDKIDFRSADVTEDDKITVGDILETLKLLAG